MIDSLRVQHILCLYCKQLQYLHVPSIEAAQTLKSPNTFSIVCANCGKPFEIVTNKNQTIIVADYPLEIANVTKTQDAN